MGGQQDVSMQDGATEEFAALSFFHPCLWSFGDWFWQGTK
jgi:hypothetical protein